MQRKRELVSRRGFIAAAAPAIAVTAAGTARASIGARPARPDEYDEPALDRNVIVIADPPLATREALNWLFAEHVDGVVGVEFVQYRAGRHLAGMWEEAVGPTTKLSTLLEAQDADRGGVAVDRIVTPRYTFDVHDATHAIKEPGTMPAIARFSGVVPHNVYVRAGLSHADRFGGTLVHAVADMAREAKGRDVVAVSPLRLSFAATGYLVEFFLHAAVLYAQGPPDGEADAKVALPLRVTDSSGELVCTLVANQQSPPL